MEGGVSTERLEFLDKMPSAEYFQTYQRMDIALDPFPYGGGTTTCDALWMGVPVISLAGKTGVGRGGISILSNVGSDGFVGSKYRRICRTCRQTRRRPATPELAAGRNARTDAAISR